MYKSFSPCIFALNNRWTIETGTKSSFSVWINNMGRVLFSTKSVTFPSLILYPAFTHPMKSAMFKIGKEGKLNRFFISEENISQILEKAQSLTTALTFDGNFLPEAIKTVAPPIEVP